MQSKQESPITEIQTESYIENVIRKHLEMIVISIIRRQQPMCGQDIVKEVFKQYKVYINQSSVYMVLYSLRDKKILATSNINGDMRSKMYIPTENGKEMINAMVDEFIFAIEYLLVVLKEHK